VLCRGLEVARVPRLRDRSLFLACALTLLGCADSKHKGHSEDGPPDGPADAAAADAGLTDAQVGVHRVDAAAPDAGLPSELGAALEAVGFTVVGEHPSEYAGYRYLDLTVTQPMDHDDPASVTFEQRIILHHLSEDAPMVLATTGYENFDQEWLMEPALVLPANQIMVEHRYFPPSIPDKADWTKLNIRQAAADFHLITEKLKRIYAGRWLNTGASKGGMTALFHRRFYPGDVDGTVAYVAPFSYGAPDNRYLQFLADINPDGCGEQVRTLQVRFIKDRVAIGKALIADFDTGPNITTEEQAALFAASTSVYYDWGFWQFSGVDSCALVSSALTSDHDAAQLLSREIVIGEAIAVGEAYTYQAVSELGYQAISTAHIDAALKEVEFPAMPAQPMPWSVWPSYHSDSVTDVASWIAQDGEHIMLVYGQYDPWTGGAIDLGQAKDARKFVVPQGNHGSQIDLLPATERDAALEMLYRWADVKRPGMSSGMRKGLRHIEALEALRRQHSLGLPPAARR
jgi:hypothetical protein